MRRGVVIAVVVLVVIAALAVAGDRAAVAVAQSQVSDRIKAELPGAEGVTTQIHGVPVLTQVAGGSLDHVTVGMTGLATSSGDLGPVTVELHGVSTTAPYVASTVEATALVPLATLQQRLGSSWTLSVEGDALKATFAGGLPAEALAVPVVRDGTIALDFRSMTLAGVEISSDAVPDFVRKAVQSLIGSFGDLPLGLVPTAVHVVPTGVQLDATGSDVGLGG